MSLILDDLGTSEDFFYERGRTQSGQRGFVAWIDGPTRKVHCQMAKCIRSDGARCIVLTDDGETELTLPSGRMEPTENLALDKLAIDLRSESEFRMKPIQEQLAAIARTLLLDLVAVEMAKKKTGQGSDRDNLEDGIKRIGHH